ncbi:hypothetical protein ACHRV6_06795 [Flavobacterium sp. FlaQc-51]|uniref:hypothetical protein n=1 Tax=Flavobacterium sp. FlaQc-51 TaxID=3374184 RepID=UPI003757CA53
MKKQFKTILACGLILSGLMFSCKKQDGYSDEVITNQKTSDSTQTSTDSSAKNDTTTLSKGSVGGAAGDVVTPNTGAESTNAAEQGTGGDPNKAKGTGTGTGPGPSAKDGAAYSGPSDPQNETIKTTKSKTTPKKDK